MLTFQRLTNPLACAALGLATLAQPACAFTIDSFSDGRITLEVPAMTVRPDGWLRADTAASVPGGLRSLALQPLPGSTALAFIGLDALGLEAYRVTNQQLYVSFGYGQTAPMNLDLGGASALRLDVAWSGASAPGGAWFGDALSVTVYATTSTGPGLNPHGSASQVRLLPGGPLDLPLSSFTVNSATGIGVDWADVDSLLFVVSEGLVGSTSAGFGLRSLSTVSAVPEPAAWALLACGLLGLVLRRR